MVALSRLLVSVLKSADPLHRLNRSLQLGRCRRILGRLLVHAAVPYALVSHSLINAVLSRANWD
eukprot:2172298-Pyramimonas_sp.AAC.1